jgi:hypothetical protein
MATRVFHLGRPGSACSALSWPSGDRRELLLVRCGDPGRSEFLVWALVLGLAECLAAGMPAAWAYDLTMIVIGGATQLFAVSATA